MSMLAVLGEFSQVQEVLFQCVIPRIFFKEKFIELHLLALILPPACYAPLGPPVVHVLGFLCLFFFIFVRFYLTLFISSFLFCLENVPFSSFSLKHHLLCLFISLFLKLISLFLKRCVPLFLIRFSLCRLISVLF